MDYINKAGDKLEQIPLIGGAFRGSGRTCVEAAFGIFLPPVLVYMRRKAFDKEFFIC